MKAIYINCARVEFVEDILNLLKTIETRNRDMLKSLVGQRVGIIETGKGKAKLKGYATIVEKIVFKNEETWELCRDLHRVPKGSEYDFKKRKVGYILADVERCEPTFINVKNNGNRSFVEI